MLSSLHAPLVTVKTHYLFQPNWTFSGAGITMYILEGTATATGLLFWCVVDFDVFIFCFSCVLLGGLSLCLSSVWVSVETN
jgi:hypothetical protein